MIKKNAQQQIEKKVESWNRTRAVKMEQAKRIQYIYDCLEIRLMFINMCVVVCAIFALSIEGNFLLKAILSYSVVAVLFQNYVSKLNLEGQVREFKLLEVNLDLLINELEGMYRKIADDENLQNSTEINLKIEMLTNKYNSYLQNIPLHLNEDYNVAMNVKRVHKKNLEEIDKPKEERTIIEQEQTKYREKIVFISTSILILGAIITIMIILSSLGILNV